MIVSGKCQIYNDGLLVDFNIIEFKTLFDEIKNKKKTTIIYKGTISKEDVNQLKYGFSDSVFILTENKIIEFKNSELKLEYPYGFSFLSKRYNLILKIDSDKHFKIHENYLFFRQDKIKNIINKLNKS